MEVLEASELSLAQIYSTRTAYIFLLPVIIFLLASAVTAGQGYAQSELDEKESSILKRKCSISGQIYRRFLLCCCRV